MQKLIGAILQVMSEVKNLQKDKDVGKGQNKYKSISGAKVRSALQVAMNKAGLTILTTNIEYKEEVARWTEKGSYNNQPFEKSKQQVRLTAKVTYLLCHSSGESKELVGIGTGVDSQDKAPGKAVSYALKYTLLNLFIIPTGLDADDIHSDDIDPPGEPIQDPKGNKEEKEPAGGKKQYKEPVAIEEGAWPKILAYAAKKRANRDAALENYILTETQKSALLKMH